MRLELVRRWQTADTLTGTLTVDGEPECYTLEALNDAIPCGTYRVSLYDSPRHGRVPLLHEVPGRTWIELHAGNTAKDTSGCILVGLTRRASALEQSRRALDPLVEEIAAAEARGEGITIEIREAAGGPVAA